MRNKIYLVFLLFGLSISFGYGQQDTQKVTEEESHRMGQDLIDLLQAGRYFEAKSLYDTICIKVDSIHPFIEYFYRMYISLFENKPDSATFYLEEMIKDHLFSDMYPYSVLWEIYAEILQDYKNARQTLDRAESYLEQNPDSLNPEKVKEHKEYLSDLKGQTERRSAEPTIRIVRENTENCTPLLEDTVLQQGYLFFNVSYNGLQPIRTLFDTGVSEYVIMDKAIADQMGVRKYPVYEHETTCTVNGIKAPGYLGVLDSLQMANITLYHIPVGVLDVRAMINIQDRVETDSIRRGYVTNLFYDALKVVLGLKTMSLLKNIVLDFDENQLCFPIDNEESSSRRDKNIFFSKNQLFTRLFLNKLPVMAFIDSGTDRYMDVNTRFYEEHKAMIPIDFSVRNGPNYRMMMGRTRNTPFDIIADEPVIMFNNKSISLRKGDNVYISSLAQWGELYPDMLESVIGFPFLKRLGKKILFDFRNMRMEVLE